MHIQLTPKAKSEHLGGVSFENGGAPLLKMSVTAVPEQGKANKAMIKALSKTWKIPKTHFSIISGLKSRRKTVLIEGDGPALKLRIS